MRTAFLRWTLGLCLLAVAAPSMAQLSQPACGQSAANLLAAAAQQQQVATATLNKDYVDPLRKSSIDPTTSMLSSCVDSNWPNPISRLPSMEQIIRGVAAAAANKLCGEARSQLSSVTSVFNQSYYLNTGIPGMPTIGGSVANSGGSVIKSLNSTTPTTNTTSDSSWSTIDNLFK